MKKLMTVLLSMTMLVAALTGTAMAKKKTYTVKSPDKRLVVNVCVDGSTTYELLYDGRQLINPSAIDLSTTEGAVEDTNWYCNKHHYFGSFNDEKAKVRKVRRYHLDKMIASPFTRSAQMRDHCNGMVLEFDNVSSIEFRAYDEGFAYRIRYKSDYKDSVEAQERVNFAFPEDYGVWAPYVSHFNPEDPEAQYFNSFENHYTHVQVSQLTDKRLAFLPLVVDCGNGVKMCLTESNIEGYPGMYLTKNGVGLSGEFARMPKKMEQGGHNNLQMMVKERNWGMAGWRGSKALPWRIVMVSTQDEQLAENNMTYLLADECRIDDLSWIKPGKVAWEWWNCWGLDGVDFKPGVNNETYKYYIDFASKHGIEYVILDEGWAVNLKADLFAVVPEIDIQELVEYGRERNVGIILWAGYYAFARDMEHVCQHYSEMGVKGFKVDFMDRDDQQMTQFVYDAAKMAAKYHMVLDLHGMFKPAGLNRTYPNVLNCEGVAGLENLKWAGSDYGQVEYDVQIPFIRQTAGPMDYTQGAMINAYLDDYRADWAHPMSQGTRCHQLGLYVVLESPLNMLCDSPTNYMKEEECTNLIAEIPTTWDDTKVLAGELGEYIVVARRKGDTWWVGGINNWTARDYELQVVLGKSAEVFSDAEKAMEYKHYTTETPTMLKLHMNPGGGFLIRIK